jgi:hypothetical protein
MWADRNRCIVIHAIQGQDNRNPNFWYGNSSYSFEVVFSAEEDRLSLRVDDHQAFAKVNKVPTSDSKCCLAAFLANIPGVSRKMALCIGAHTMDPDICSSLSHPDGVDALKNIQFGSRKIGPSISAKIAVAKDWQTHKRLFVRHVIEYSAHKLKRLPVTLDSTWSRFLQISASDRVFWWTRPHFG